MLHTVQLRDILPQMRFTIITSPINTIQLDRLSIQGSSYSTLLPYYNSQLCAQHEYL